MAVRFDNDGESYTRATGLGSVSVFSFACWVKLAASRATTTVPLQIDNGSGTGRMRINAFNGTQLTFQSDGTTWFGNFGLTLTVGTWAYVALSATANPGQVRTAAREAGSNTWAGATASQANITMNAATLRIGDGQAASEWVNGSIAAVKVWDQALTVEELRAESWTYLPQRSAGLRGWYPLLIPETTDYSGLVQTLSGGTGAALDVGPSIIWGAVRRRVYIPATATTITGSLAATLPALTSSASGTVKASGTLTAALPPLAAAAAATAKTAGTLTVGLPHLGASFAGAIGQAGALSATFPALTATMQGTVRGGFLTSTLPALTAAATGQIRFAGTLPATLPALIGSLSGAVVIPPYDLTVSAGSPQRGWASQPPETAWASNATATSWGAGLPVTAWPTPEPGRNWTAGQPTT